MLLIIGGRSVQTNFDDLFDENGEIRIIAMKVELTCKNISNYTYIGYSNQDPIYGIIIKKSLNDNSKFYCSAIISNPSHNYETIESTEMEIENELYFKCKGLGSLAFSFSQYKCDPSDNPIDNFYVVVNGDHFGINTTWHNEVKGYYWDEDQKWALEQVLEYMETH